MLSFASFQYLPFDRTLFRGVRRTYALHEGEAPLPLARAVAAYERHRAGPSTEPDPVVAVTEAILDEIEAATAPYQRVNVLLSGGLDSRLILASVLELRRRGRAISEVRTLSWGQEQCADVHIAGQISQSEGVSSTIFHLDAAQYLANIGEASRLLGPIISPVHLHALPRVASIAGEPSEITLVGSLGNAVIRGEFLWRNFSYSVRPRPRDWLGLLDGDARVKAAAELEEIWEEVQAGMIGHRADRHELSMLLTYYQNMLLSTYNYLDRRGVNYYQVFSDPRVWREARGLHPLRRNASFAMACIRRLWPSLSTYSTADEAGPGARDSSLRHLRPSMHDYRGWSLELLDELGSWASQAPAATAGVIAESAAASTVARVRRGGRGALEASYLLGWLAVLGHGSNAPGVQPPTSADNAGKALPPWGFASRPHDVIAERVVGRAGQAWNLLTYPRK